MQSIDVLKKIYPNLKYTKINEINNKMKYIAIRNYEDQQFIFLDECVYYGNVTTIIRKQCINQKNAIDLYIFDINITIDVDKSYFNNVELYQITS